MYTNEDGSVQFIELVTNSNGQQFLGGGSPAQLISTNLAATITNTYTFPSDSPFPTGGHHLLVTTPDFGSLPGGVAPDFDMLPADFLFPAGGTLKLGDTGTGGFQTAFNFTYGVLPTDGFDSLNPIAQALNSPTNYATQSGSVPEPSTLAVIGLAASVLLTRRRSTRQS